MPAGAEAALAASAHATTEDRWTPLARGLLYLYGHRLRMPLHLLRPHLLRKAVRQLLPKEKP